MCLHTYCKCFEETAQVTIMSELSYFPCFLCKNLSSVICNNKGADQPAHPRSLIFFAFMQLVICDHAPAQRNVEDSGFVSAVPHSNQHTVGTASWQNHDSSPPAVCYYTALSCLSRSIKPLHFLRIVEAM